MIPLSRYVEPVFECDRLDCRHKSHSDEDFVDTGEEFLCRWCHEADVEEATGKPRSFVTIREED